MLKSLSLRNFRAFRDQSFKFAKINIFVGPNNSGKSSAISAINMIAQNVANVEVGGSSLVLNGQFDNLGTFIDLVHGNRSNTPLGIEFEFDSFYIKSEYKYRQQRREIELVRFELKEQEKSQITYINKKDSFDIMVGGSSFESLFPNVRKVRPIFSGFIPYARFLDPYFMRSESKVISENLIDKLLKINRSTSRARMRLRDLFANFDSISPFRDRPQRTYLYSGETAQTIGLTGSNLAAVLSNDAARRGGESKGMSTEISRWFRVSGIADEVKIRSLTPRHFEIVVADKYGNEHNICDVGFGCSQVLPVLAASLNLFGGAMESMLRRPTPILVVQEPEIHLHPNAQAALGSFFTGMLRQRGQLFIETHSDTLVLRIARHVAEGLLDASDVKIFYVHKENGNSVVEEMGITQDGIFSPEWPGGFFPQRQSESLDLAKASYRGSKNLAGKQLEFRYPEER
jgi:predicted ATPase